MKFWQKTHPILFVEHGDCGGELSAIRAVLLASSASCCEMVDHFFVADISWTRISRGCEVLGHTWNSS